jgi:hypothetical protein
VPVFELRNGDGIVWQIVRERQQFGTCAKGKIISIDRAPV